MCAFAQVALDFAKRLMLPWPLCLSYDDDLFSLGSYVLNAPSWEKNSSRLFWKWGISLIYVDAGNFKFKLWGRKFRRRTRGEFSILCGLLMQLPVGNVYCPFPQSNGRSGAGEIAIMLPLIQEGSKEAVVRIVELQTGDSDLCRWYYRAMLLQKHT